MVDSTLYLHDRHHVVCPVSATAQAALFAMYGDDPSPDHRHIALQFVQDLADRRSWLACDCTGLKADPPILAPRRSKYAMHLVRLHKRPHHSATCPFAHELRIVDSPTADEEAVESKPTKPLERPWSFGVIGQAAKPLAKSAPAVREPHGHTEPTMPALGLILMSILDAAGLDRVHGDDVEKRDSPKGHTYLTVPAEASYRRLYRLARERMHDGRAFEDVVCTNPALIFEYRDRAIAALTDVAPRGFYYVLLVADTVDEHHLVYQSHGKDQRLRLDGPVRMFGVPQGTRGPYWALVRMRVDFGSQWATACDTYVHPMVSRSILMPVDSHLERQVARHLLEQAIFWRDTGKMRLTVDIVKPLFDIEDGHGAFARPAFLIVPSDGTAAVALEVIGTQGDPADEMRKERALPPGRTLPGVTELLEIEREEQWNDIRPVLSRAVYATAKRGHSFKSAGSRRDPAVAVPAG